MNEQHNNKKNRLKVKIVTIRDIPARQAGAIFSRWYIAAS